MHREQFASVVVDAQSRRVPSIVAGVVLPDGEVWQHAVGSASVDPQHAADADTQYRVGSLTKTFTAAIFLQLCADGVVDLDDRLSSALPEAAPGRVTFRQLLSHSSGICREIPTGLWRSFRGPTRDEFFASLADAEQVLPVGTAWHYSNLGYSLLGAAVEARTGRNIRELISERLLAPLELHHTQWQPSQRPARGYWVHPDRDLVCVEPDFETGSMSAAGQLWSSAVDVARWGRALAGLHPGVVAPQVVDAMHQLTVLVDPADWTRGWGLGLDLRLRNGKMLSGHDGVMPGFLASVSLHRDSGTVAVALANASTGLDTLGLADRLVLMAAGSSETPQRVPWKAPEPCPAEYVGVLGQWWAEGERAAFRWRDGRLEGNREGWALSRFDLVEPDMFRCAEGPERGELLKVIRDAEGAAVELDWAGYPYARHPYQEASPLGS